MKKLAKAGKMKMEDVYRYNLVSFCGGRETQSS